MIKLPSLTHKVSSYFAPAKSATTLVNGNSVNFLPLIDFVTANIKILYHIETKVFLDSKKYLVISITLGLTCK